MAIEGKHYPIAGVMYHPETQWMSVHGEDKQALKGKIKNEVTDSIMYWYSEFIHRQAKMNLIEENRRFPDKETAKKVLYMEAEMNLHIMYTSKVLTYGVNNKAAECKKTCPADEAI